MYMPDNSSPTFLCVGRKLPEPFRSKLGNSFSMNIGAAEGITIFGGLPALTEQEIRAARSAPVTLGFLREGDAAFGIAFVPGLITADMPYDHSLPPPHLRGLPERSPTEGLLVQIIVADTVSGIVRALRFVSITPKFSALIEHELARLDTRVGSPDWNHRADVVRAYRKYPTPDAMMAAASHRETAGISFPKN